MEFTVDREVCAVPAKMLVTKDVEECQVNWTNGQTYDASVLACGRSFKCLFYTSAYVHLLKLL